MKHSIYNVIYKKNGFVLIFNTFKCSSIVLNDEAYIRYENFDLLDEEKTTLTDLGFIVDDKINEMELFLTKSRIATSNSNNLVYRIYTTLGCNAKCPYCYQSELQKQTMTPQIADMACDFILKQINNEKHLVLEWFGGEPLCNHKIITYITQKLTPELNKRQVTLSSKMVSNGYLFDKNLILTAKNLWNLKRVQITLDGLAEEYEKVKQFSNKDPFYKVIKNIELLTENKINVAIRINYCEENLIEIFKLLEYLADKFKNNKYINIYGHAIFGKVDDLNISDNTKLDIKFFKKMQSLGISKELLENVGCNNSRCMAYSLKNALIYPDGTLYKCPQEVGNSNLSVGHVNSGINNDLIYKWCSPYLPPKCTKCKFLPLCNGGCTYVRRNNQKSCAINKQMLNIKLETAMNTFLHNKEKYKEV